MVSEREEDGIYTAGAKWGESKDYATLPGYLYVWSMTSDSQKIFCGSSRLESDVWLAEDFDPY